MVGEFTAGPGESWRTGDVTGLASDEDAAKGLGRRFAGDGNPGIDG